MGRARCNPITQTATRFSDTFPAPTATCSGRTWNRSICPYGSGWRRRADPSTPSTFFDAGVASITTSVQHKTPIEIGIVWREGFVNLPVLTGIYRSPSETFMQIGAGFRIDLKRVREAMAQSPTLMPILLRFVDVYMVQTASTVLANGRARGLNLRLRSSRAPRPASATMRVRSSGGRSKRFLQFRFLIPEHCGTGSDARSRPGLSRGFGGALPAQSP